MSFSVLQRAAAAAVVSSAGAAPVNRHGGGLLPASASLSPSASSFLARRRCSARLSRRIDVLFNCLSNIAAPKSQCGVFCLLQSCTTGAGASLQGSSKLSTGALAALGTRGERTPFNGGVFDTSFLLRSHHFLPSFCGEVHKLPSRGIHTGRRIDSSSSSDNSSSTGLLLSHLLVSAKESTECSRHCYLILTALLSSVVLLTIDRGARRRRHPVACEAATAIAGAGPQLVPHDDEPPLSAALQLIPHPTKVLLGPRRRSMCVAGRRCCSHIVSRNSSSRSESSDRSGEEPERRKVYKSRVKRKGTKSKKCGCDMHFRWKAISSPVVAWKHRRAVASCEATEKKSSGRPAAVADALSLQPVEGGRTTNADVKAEPHQQQGNFNSSHMASSRPVETKQQNGILGGASSASGTAGVVVSSRGSEGQEAKLGGVEQRSHSVAAREEQHNHHHHDSPLWRSEENRPFERKLEDALLFCGNSNQPLATAVADRLSTKLGRVAVKRFADGEVNIQFLDSLRGKDVYLIQPTSSPVNEHLMELLLMISTCRRASAKKITAVIPYYGYARQDRKLSSRVPISAADVARMIEAMGVDRVVAVDLHCGQIQGFFGPRVPVDNLEAQIIGLEYFQHKNLQKPVVVSPDAGGVYRARKFQEGLLARGYRDCGIAMLIKQRLRANEIERMDLVGSVEGSDVVIVDDMIDTAGTLCEAARELRAKGARRVFAFATHGLFSGPAIHRIESSPLEEVVVTDSIKARPEVLNCPRITSLSISVLLADAIRRIHQKESLNDLFMVKSWQ